MKCEKAGAKEEKTENLHKTYFCPLQGEKVEDVKKKKIKLMLCWMEVLLKLMLKTNLFPLHTNKSVILHRCFIFAVFLN